MAEFMTHAAFIDAQLKCAACGLRFRRDGNILINLTHPQ